MLVVRTIKQLQEELNQRRQASQSIALVPTMGNLHEGHLQLVKTAQQQADIVVVTLFVNPTQFGANEDLDNYPRTFQHDCNQLESINANILFAPSINEIYPLGGKNILMSTFPTSRICCVVLPDPAILMVSPRLSVNCLI